MDLCCKVRLAKILKSWRGTAPVGAMIASSHKTSVFAATEAASICRYKTKTCGVRCNEGFAAVRCRTNRPLGYGWLLQTAGKFSRRYGYYEVAQKSSKIVPSGAPFSCVYEVLIAENLGRKL